MVIKEQIKTEVINYIDELNKLPKYSDSYSKRLRQYRDKYIYKDIGFNELKSDVNEINSIKEQIVFLKNFWS
jgi:hypothetical protein